VETVIRNLFLNQWFIVFVLGVIFVLFSRWAMSESRLGYALGWLTGIFAIVVYTALGGADPVQQDIEQTLYLLEVLIPTLCGLLMGGGVITVIALVRANREREQALLIAFLTALNITLLFLVLVEGRATQLMIGIFALAFGIASLFAAIFTMDRFSDDDSGNNGGNGNGNSQPRSAQDIRDNRTGRDRSRIDRMRDNIDNR
jgi:hypothetical protein